MNRNRWAGVVGLLLILAGGSGCDVESKAGHVGESPETNASAARSDDASSSAEGADDQADPGCSELSSALIIDALGPATVAQARDYAKAPREAARRLKESKALGSHLGDGDLVLSDTAATSTVFGVLDGDQLRGQIYVRPMGHGTFGAVRVELCRR